MYAVFGIEVLDRASCLILSVTHTMDVSDVHIPESGNTKTFGVLARAQAETGTFATCVVQKEMNYYTPT